MNFHPYVVQYITHMLSTFINAQKGAAHLIFKKIISYIQPVKPVQWASVLRIAVAQKECSQERAGSPVEPPGCALGNKLV